MKRPRSVTFIGWLYIAAGTIGLVYHAAEFKRGAFQYELLWVCLVRLLAVVGGVFLLRGNNWARWLAGAWMAYHVVLSAFHPVRELVVHALFLILIAYMLFRPAASAYFRSGPPSALPKDRTA